MFAVTDRTEPARGFRPQPLPTQTGRHGFHVELVTLSTKLIRQACAACVAFWWLMLVLSCESLLTCEFTHLVACPLLLGKINGLADRS